MASKVHCLLFVKKKFNRAILLITIVSFAVCKESKKISLKAGLKKAK